MSAQVFNVERPFVLVVDAELDEDFRSQILVGIREAVAKAAGHSQFVVLHVPSKGAVRLSGWEELRSEVEKALGMDLTPDSDVAFEGAEV